MLKNVNKFLTLKNVKQAAYVAPEQTPVEPGPTTPAGGYVIPEGAKTYEVELEAATGYPTVHESHNIAELVAGGDPNATVQMAYLNENGELAWQDWTVTDGWFGTEGGKGHGEGCVACIKPNADGTFTFFGVYPEAQAGTTATAIFNYGNDVIVAITVNVVEPAPVEPGPDFVAPEADDEFNVEVIEGKEGSYDYLTAEKEVEILAALGLDGDYDYEGALKDAKDEGALTIMGYNPDGTMADLQGTTDGWMKADGYMITWGTDGFAVCIKPWMEPLGIYINMVAGDEAVGYFAFVAGDSQYVVKANVTIAPKPADPVFEVVKTYEFTRDVVYVADHGAVAETFSIEAQMTDIEGFIGGTPDTFQMSAYNDNLEPIFQSWSVTDGWFGVDGAAYWGSDARFCMKPTATGTFNSDCCMPDVSAGTTGKCTFRYGYTETMKAVDVVITVNIAAE